MNHPFFFKRVHHFKDLTYQIFGKITDKKSVIISETNNFEKGEKTFDLEHNCFNNFEELKSWLFETYVINEEHLINESEFDEIKKEMIININ